MPAKFDSATQSGASKEARRDGAKMREALLEQIATALLDVRGFRFYSDPMEGGQDAYDISLQALEEARALLPFVRHAKAQGMREAAEGALRAAVEATPREAVVSVPLSVARLIDHVYLPTNIAKLRTAAPEVKEAVASFKSALAAKTEQS